MRFVLWVALFIDQLLILILSATDLKKYQLTDFQLKAQLEGKSDKKSQLLRRLHKNLPYVLRQQQLELLLLFSVGAILFTYLITPYVLAFAWLMVATLLIAMLRRVSLIKKYSYQLFEEMLDIIIKVSLLMKPLWWAVGIPEKDKLVMPTSQQELEDLISKASVISVEERERLNSVLEADEKTARDIMTLSRKVRHVVPSDTLGPVLLADLEKSGHRYFPVYTQKDGVLGMLNLRVLSDIGTAKSLGKVSDVMEQDLVWVPDDMPVFEVAQMFLSAKQYVLMVQNEDHEFAGIITVADLLKHTIAVV